MPILLGLVWTVGCHIGCHRLVVLHVEPCRDGVCTQDGCPLSPGRVSGACLSLSGMAYLMKLDLPPLFPRGRDGGEIVWCCIACSKRRRERGHGGPRGLVPDLGSLEPWRAKVAGPRLVRPPERLTIRCLEIPRVS
jgi:hypothetical protein